VGRPRIGKRGEKSPQWNAGSPGSSARKAASAMIAKIPLPLARHIASIYRVSP
jgi:hypothetical protein